MVTYVDHCTCTSLSKTPTLEIPCRQAPSGKGARRAPKQMHEQLLHGLQSLRPDVLA